MTRLLRYRHDGLTFAVRDEGPLDGDPVVLLHGFPERATSWRKVAPLLHPHGLRTYAPDQRGYSRDARPPRRRDYRLGRLVGDVTRLAETIGSPVHLVGHDWGSVVAWRVAAERPELVRTLTAVSVPHPGAFLRSELTPRQALLSWYLLAFQVPRLPERLLSRQVSDGYLRRGGMTAEEIDRFRSDIVEDGALRGGLMWYRAMFLEDPRQMSGPVRVPTTLVWSDGDAYVGRAGVDRTPAYVEADYRLVELPGVSHWIPTQAPEALAAAVLDRIDPSR